MKNLCPSRSRPRFLRDWAEEVREREDRGDEVID